jgi:hypothetical protein
MRTVASEDVEETNATKAVLVPALIALVITRAPCAAFPPRIETVNVNVFHGSPAQTGRDEAAEVGVCAFQADAARIELVCWRFMLRQRFRRRFGFGITLGGSSGV